MSHARYTFHDLVTRCLLAAFATGMASAVLLSMVVMLLAS